MATMRPFRFSILAGAAKTRQEWLTKARRAEELGYSALLVTDHMVETEVDLPTALMAAADATSLRIGAQVFCTDFRHPVVLARQAANLDLFSEGRFQLGLGCGYLAEEYQQTGIPLDPAGIRISRFAEALEIIKAYFREDQVTFSGQYFQVHNLKTVIKTVQKPHPPIYIGGGGKRVLSIAAREADIVGLAARNNAHGLDWISSLPTANFEKLQWIREAAGARFSALEFSATIFIAVVTDHPQPVAQQIGGHLGLSADQLFECSHALLGSVDQIVDELQKRRELFGISCIEVVETHMEALAPVVARLAGR